MKNWGTHGLNKVIVKNIAAKKNAQANIFLGLNDVEGFGNSEECVVAC